MFRLRLDCGKVENANLKAVDKNRNIQLVKEDLNLVKLPVVQHRKEIPSDHVLRSFSSDHQVAVLE